MEDIPQDIINSIEEISVPNNGNESGLLRYEQQVPQQEILNHLPHVPHAVESGLGMHQFPPQHHIPTNHLVNTTYQHYIHSIPTGMPHIPLNYEDNNKDENSKKRRRTNYKDPENANKLNAALSSLINQSDGEGQKDLKTVAKMYNLPYNTLRDNFLK
jgi:hypothetical protein